MEGEGFRIGIEPNPGYLRAHVAGGEDPLEASLAIWRLLGDECACVVRLDCWSSKSFPGS